MENLEKEYQVPSDFYETMEQVFELMPKTFTSRQFGRKAKILGVPKKILLGGFAGRFLLMGDKAVKISRYVYKKNQGDTVQVELNLNSSDKDVENAINLLKSLGYRITKEVTEIKEY